MEVSISLLEERIGCKILLLASSKPRKNIQFFNFEYH